MADLAIRVEGLSKVFGRNPRAALELAGKGCSKEQIMAKTGNVLALYYLSLSIARGENFVVMGLSGSGKSTLARCINRLVEPTAGRIFVEDAEATALSRAELRELRSTMLGMVPQNFALLPHRSVLDNVAFGLEVRGTPKPERLERAQQVLRLVGLEEWQRAKPAELSGGMKQRVGLARALAMDPPILLMDEPFSGLDPLIRRDMQQELLHLQSRIRKTIVFISHSLEEAITLGDRIAILNQGLLVQIGSPTEIVLSPNSEYVERFVADVNLLNVLTAGDVAEKDVSAWTAGTAPAFAPDQAIFRRAPYVFVIEKDGRFRGVVGVEEFFGRGPEKAGSQPLPISKDVPTVRPGAPIRHPLRPLADSGPPAVVLDAENLFRGVIDPRSILKSLAAHRQVASEA